jgi:hypothetical protein
MAEKTLSYREVVPKGEKTLTLIQGDVRIPPKGSIKSAGMQGA